MTERELLRDFLKDLKKAGIFYRREGDTFGGHKKPFDFWILNKGRMFAIEAKKDDAKLEPHQHEGLQNVVDNGGYSFVLRFRHNGKHERDVFIYPYKEGVETSRFWGMWYDKGYCGNPELSAGNWFCDSLVIVWRGERV